MTEPFVIGSVGRMTSEKNQIHLVNIMPELLKKREDCFLLLIGAGSEMESIKEYAVQLGVSEHVLFLGSQQNVYEWLNVFDVFVMPSLYEGFPIAAIEAASNGLPLVLSDTITDELTFLENVRYLPLDGSYSSWVDSILGAKRDIGKNSHRMTILLKEYDIHSCAKILETIYTNQLLRNRHEKNNKR